jgi:hypothetical protein
MCVQCLPSFLKVPLSVLHLLCVATLSLASEHGEYNSVQQWQDLDELTADLSSTVRSRTTNPPGLDVQETQDSLARMTLGGRQNQTPMRQSPLGSAFNPRTQASKMQQGSSSVDQQRGRSLGYERSQGVEASMLQSFGPRELSFAAPTTEQRRNVTKRRSNGRVRDSLDSTSVPISSLLSRKPKDRIRDVAYLEKTVSPKREDGVSRTPLTHSPVSSKREDVISHTSLPHRAEFTRRLIPSIHEHFDLHQALMKLWIQKKIIEDDMNEIQG